MSAISTELSGAALRRVLVVDDDPDLLRLMSIRLGAAGYIVATALSAEEALRLIVDEPPQVVVTDLRMEGMDGMALFERIHTSWPGLPVIMLTAHGTIPDAVEATRGGVFGYLTKPFDGQILLAEIDRAMSLGAHPPGDDDLADTGTAWRSAIISRSAAMEEVLRKAAMVAASDASVLLQGDSGTGKELLARAVHLASARKDGPFIAVNCAAIPEPLLESELFGHVKGAYTGASRERAGLILSAAGGTLFLDEIGDMPLALQVKLLRVLQERRVRPIGAEHHTSVNLRVVSATHRDLQEEITQGRFREDLYYRLNVVRLRLPTLAERREDIPLIANHGLARLTGKYDKPIRGFAPKAMELLLQATWPGNVRQLLNVVEQSVALCNTPLIPASLVAEAMQHTPSQPLPLEEARRRFEHDYLIDLMRAAEGNVSLAARLAGRNRTEFYRLMQRHHLSPTQFKP
ncbi:MAG TPA: sigma 54-interacting transcriptional regulator [Parasulfuritortus sp.]